jgi:hypothetical protein
MGVFGSPKRKRLAEFFVKRKEELRWMYQKRFKKG